MKVKGCEKCHVCTNHIYCQSISAHVGPKINYIKCCNNCNNWKSFPKVYYEQNVIKIRKIVCIYHNMPKSNVHRFF